VYFSKLNLIILIILAALLYFMLIYIFRVMDKIDMNLLRHLIERGERTGYY